MEHGIMAIYHAIRQLFHLGAQSAAERRGDADAAKYHAGQYQQHRALGNGRVASHFFDMFRSK